MKIYKLTDFDVEKGVVNLELCQEEQRPEIEILYEATSGRVDGVENANWWNEVRVGLILLNHEHDDGWYLVDLGKGGKG